MGKAGRLHRTRLVRMGLGALLAIMPTLAGWLGAPARPQADWSSLIDDPRLARCAIVMEFRDVSSLARRVLTDERMERIIAVAFTGPHEELGVDVSMLARKRLVAFRDLFPYALRAIATGTEGDGGNPVFALSLSNGARLFVWLQCRWDEVGVERRIAEELGMPECSISFDRGLVWVVSKAIAAEAQGIPVAMPVGAAPFPGCGILLRLRPDAAFRDRVRNHFGDADANSLGDAFVSLAVTDSGMALRTEALLAASRLKAFAAEARVRFPASNESTRLRPILLPDDDAVFSCSAGGGVAAVWLALGNALFGKQAHPQAAWNDPLTVLVWSALEKGVISHSRGGLALQAFRGTAPQGTVPVPDIRGAMTVLNAAESFDRLNAGMAEAISFFRRPAGDPLWREVRRESRLEISREATRSIARMHVNPLFFHGKAPQWSITPDAPGVLFWQTGDVAGNAGLPHIAGTEAVPADIFAHCAAEWNVAESDLSGLEDLLMDKIEQHGWVPLEAADPVRKAFWHARRFFALTHAGRIEWTLRKAASGEDSENSEDEANDGGFRLDMTGWFEFNQALIQDGMPN